MIFYGLTMDCLHHLNSLMYNKPFNLKKYLNYQHSWSEGSKMKGLERRDLSHGVIPTTRVGEKPESGFSLRLSYYYYHLRDKHTALK